MTFATTKRAMLTAAAVVCLLWTVPAASQLIDGPVEIASQIEAARAEYGTLLNGFEAARSDFEAFLVELDALKGEREDATAIANDDAVRDALREARDMALALSARSVAMRELADRIAELEQRLRALVDARLAELEEQLRLDATADPNIDRRQILNDINALSELRSNYMQPIQAVPDVQFDAILLDLEEDTTPEELLATADELSDNERRLQEHLSELDERISSLERQLELRDRDLMFRRESALFEEGRNTGRSASRSSTAGGQAAAADSSRTMNDTTSGGSQNAGDSGDSGDPVGVVVVPAFGVTGGAEGGGDDETTSGGSDVPAGLPDDGMDNDPPTDSYDGDGDNGFPGEDPSRAADDPGAGWEPELSAPSLTGESGPRGDPTVLWTNVLGDEEDDINLSVRGELNQLQHERERASRTLEEIQRQRQLLLQRVEELEDLENY